jgi:hypothetical protein
MPRPPVVVIPGPTGMGGSKSASSTGSALETFQALSVLADLYNKTIGAAKISEANEAATEGAMIKAGFMNPVGMKGGTVPTMESPQGSFIQDLVPKANEITLASSSPGSEGQGMPLSFPLSGLVNMPSYDANMAEQRSKAAQSPIMQKQVIENIAKIFEPEKYSFHATDLGLASGNERTGKANLALSAPNAKTPKEQTQHLVSQDKTSPTGWRHYLYDAETDNYTKAGPPAPPPQSSQAGVPKVADISGMRKEFEGSQIYKDYVTVKPQSEKIKRAYDMIGKNNVAVDQTIITVLNKMLDPTSVVRESEYARTPQNISLINRVSGIIGKQGYGGAGLTNEDRKSILDMAMQFGNITESYYKEHEKAFRDIADYYGIKHNLIITTPKFKFGTQPSPIESKGISEKGKTPLTATNPTTGEKIISSDGGKTWQKAQ